VSAFYRVQGELWADYPTGVLEFTRAYSRVRVFDPMALVIDPSGMTLDRWYSEDCQMIDPKLPDSSTM
jgi:hypothetical protein